MAMRGQVGAYRPGANGADHDLSEKTGVRFESESCHYDEFPCYARSVASLREANIAAYQEVTGDRGAGRTSGPASFDSHCDRFKRTIVRTMQDCSHSRFEVPAATPRWTGPSTNASCQLEKAENWYAKTWGPASTPGVECATPRIIVSSGREGAARNRCGMWRIQARAAASAAVKKMGLGVGTQTMWLPIVDAFRTIRTFPPDGIHTAFQKAQWFLPFAFS